MYAMSGKLIAQDGKRNALVFILKQAATLVGELPECQAYIVCEDLANETNVWIFEIWADKQSHDSSLNDTRVRSLITQAKPLLAAAPDGTELSISGGHGIPIH